MRNGRFGNGSGIHPEYFDRVSSKLMNLLLGLSFGDLGQVSVDQDVRVKFLEDIIDYYRLHIHGFGAMKSLAVLHEIYKVDEDTRYK